jgi:DNA modification methylase
LEKQSINTCVTSPPYWGLRDYGVTNQLGSEETPEAFVENLVKVFREVKRVLRDDGTVWLNLGDSYYNYRPGKGQAIRKQTVSQTDQDLPKKCSRRANKLEGLKEKDLIGIPWRVAFALQADGWYLRQDIIWYKPNPMPESMKDRCTKAHEYIFLLSQNKNYYYDNEAIKEPAKGSQPTKNRRSVWTVTTKPFRGAHFSTFPMDLIEPCVLAGCPEGGVVLDPFAGSGTVGLVANQNNRDSILIELNSDYNELIEERFNQGMGLFSELTIRT